MKSFHKFPWFTCALVAAFSGIFPGAAPAQQAEKAPLTAMTISGLRSLPPDLILAESGLKNGDPVGREELQAAADRLAQLGLFSKINYEFKTRNGGLSVNFVAEENPRVPVFFDNIPWFTDQELNDAIRKTIPYYDGSAPEGGSLLDRIGESLGKFLEGHQLRVDVEHELIGNPLGDGAVQEYKITGGSLRISRIEFSDPLALSSKGLQIHVSELLGKPFSRLSIELFLAEHVKPFYVAQGYLRVKIGPPEIRLSGNPAKPLPEEIPVFIPVVTGAVYQWNGADWKGNSALPAIQLNDFLGLKSGAIADAVAIQADFDKVRDEYGRRGFVEARLDAQPAFDDQAHKVSYHVTVTEGWKYQMGEIVVTGTSLAAEKLLRAAFPVAAGEVFDKVKFEHFLARIQKEGNEIFGELPVHYTEVGHWLRTDPQKKTVDVLLDFK